MKMIIPKIIRFNVLFSFFLLYSGFLFAMNTNILEDTILYQINKKTYISSNNANFIIYPSDTSFILNRSSRNFGSPTAYSLEKNNWYFRNEMLYFNTMYYGITDRITVGGGLKSNLPHTLYGVSIGVKYSFISRKYFASAIGATFDYDILRGYLIKTEIKIPVYSVSTVRLSWVHFSLYIDPYSYSSLDKSESSVAGLHLKFFPNKKLSFITENWGRTSWNTEQNTIDYFGKLGFMYSIKRFDIGLGYGGLLFQDWEDSMFPLSLPFVSVSFNNKS
ncbi:MAG: hypothetical protein U9N85_14435 [Bacteroidota bacterium]|nr:hypothetical protein [Bacteroidota bacterium]